MNRFRSRLPKLSELYDRFVTDDAQNFSDAFLHGCVMRTPPRLGSTSRLNGGSVTFRSLNGPTSPTKSNRQYSCVTSLDTDSGNSSTMSLMKPVASWSFARTLDARKYVSFLGKTPVRRISLG